MWDIKEHNFNNGINGKLTANIKNSNYEAFKNIQNLKYTTSDLFGAIGYLAELNLLVDQVDTNIFTPKVFTRFSPNYMKINEGSRLNMLNVYKLTS